MKIILWNIEWASTRSVRGRYIKEFVDRTDPDIICFTEAVPNMLPEHGHVIESNPDYGYKSSKDRRKVILWSKEPWTKVDAHGSDNMPSGRFVSGVTQGIEIIGICIPWHDAHVSTGRKDRSRWQDHIDYLCELQKILATKPSNGIARCILGDYNQRIPRAKQPLSVFNSLTQAFENELTVHTAGLLDPDGKPLIDHIATSTSMKVDVENIHGKTTTDGLRLSDHVGITARLYR